MRGEGTRRPTPWRADSHESYRWPDKAAFTHLRYAGNCAAGPKARKTTETERQLAAMIRPACVARCMSPRP